MSTPEDAGKYSIENQQPAVGQNIGDHNTNTQNYIGIQNHFYGSDGKPIPPLPAERVWNVPFSHNPFFTGREEILAQLHASFHAGSTAILSQPQALNGLGGVGKTQIAIEYGYHYHQEYQYVLWTGAETRDALLSGYVEIAQLLHLSQKDERDQNLVVKAVLQWFKTHTQWLLILDNADELTIVHEFLPPLGGHVLLTTRAQATGRLAQCLEVKTMNQELGGLFLLRRAGLVCDEASLNGASSANISLVKEISEEMGGLPLALDQAGAYIEAVQCSLLDYLLLYREHRVELLKERGGFVPDHPDSVAITWSLSFAKVEQTSPGAADLLRLCAFLHPDAIPEEIFTGDSEHLSPQLQVTMKSPVVFNQSIHALLTYSMVQRNSEEHLLSVHKLVQVVLRDEMDKQTQRQWAERAIQVVCVLLPVATYKTWTLYERYLQQGQMCAEWIKQMNIYIPEAIQLLDRIGTYLLERVRPIEAEPFLLGTLPIIAHMPEAGYYVTAHILDRLAYCSELQGDYTNAELLYAQSLAINENNRGPNHVSTANSLNNLAGIYQKQGKYEQAQNVCIRALEILEQQLSIQHHDTVVVLHSLVMIIFQSASGNDEILEQLERMLEHALVFCKDTQGLEHPDTANILNDLGVLYYSHKKYEQAELMLKQALTIREQLLEPEHPDIAQSLNNLGELHHSQKKYREAEPLLERALAIREQKQGYEHLDTSQSLGNLAALYNAQEKFVEAEPLYHHALVIREQQLGLDHPDTIRVVRDYISLLQKIGYEKDIAQIEARYPTSSFR